MCEVISEVSFYSLFQLTEGEFFYDDNEKIKTKENFCISHTSFFIIIQEKKFYRKFKMLVAMPQS